MSHLIVRCLSLLLSLSYALPHTQNVSAFDKRAVIYTPTDWKLPKDMDIELKITIMKPQANEGFWLNSCGRWGGYVSFDRMVGVNWKCYQDTEVLGGKPGGPGPCRVFPDKVKGNREAGLWPGKAVNCILFSDEQCRYSKMEDGKLVRMPSVVLQPPGIDALEVGWWKDNSGFKDGGGHNTGPKAYQCYIRGKGNVGLGNTDASQGFAGLGAGY